MIKIEFAIPMITSIMATMDMDKTQAKNARKLFCYALAVEKSEDGVRLISPKEAKADALFGCEAVLAYMESLGLEEAPMKGIPVHTFLELATNFDEAYDLMYLMSKVQIRNDRVARLMKLGAPEIIMHNECRILWEAVERLFFNRFTPNPATYTIDSEEEGDKPETHIRTCVMDLVMKSVPEEDEEE